MTGFELASAIRPTQVFRLPLAFYSGIMAHYPKWKTMSLCIRWKNCRGSSLKGNSILTPAQGYCFCISKPKATGMVTVTVHLRDVKESRSRQQQTQKTLVTAWPKRIPGITESHQYSSQCHPCSRDPVKAAGLVRWCLPVILIKATSLCNSGHPVKHRLRMETCLLFLSTAPTSPSKGRASSS